MRDHRVMRRAELAGDARRLGLGLNARELDSLVDLDEFDTVELAQEIHMPPGPPEFAVGDRLEADLLLLGDDLADFFVFDGGEAIGGNGACLMLGAGFLEAGSPQEGTDMIGAEGRLRPRHRFLPEVANRQRATALSTRSAAVVPAELQAVASSFSRICRRRWSEPCVRGAAHRLVDLRAAGSAQMPRPSTSIVRSSTILRMESCCG